MSKRFCKQCGSALNEGARFCTSCGALAVRAETASVFAPETRPLPGQQTDQPAPNDAGGTEELPSARTPSSDYNTKELPQVRSAAQAEEKSTTVVADASVTRPQQQRAMAPVNQSSGARKGLLLAAVLGTIVLAVGSLFFVNSRRSSETQTANQSADQG